MKLTIPELAEQIRQHLNTDNDAKRLICEHVLPLVGIDVTKPEEIEHLYDASDLEDLLDQVKCNLDNDLARYGDVIPEEALDALKLTLEAITTP